MFQALLKKQDNTNLLVLGLSHMNLQQLQEKGPAVIDMEKLGFKGKLLLSLEKDGKIAVPVDETTQVLCLREDQLEPLREGKMLRLGIECENYTGEIALFSARDERTMEEMFSFMVPPGQSSSTCPVCRTGFREDGSCTCGASLH